MDKNFIQEVSIDRDGRLCIKPSSGMFTHIYRAAAGVYWDQDKKYLHSTTPNDMSYSQWFGHIIAVVKDEYGDNIYLSEKTTFVNIEDKIIKEIKGKHL